jgi:hypothetical protein
MSFQEKFDAEELLPYQPSDAEKPLNRKLLLLEVHIHVAGAVKSNKIRKTALRTGGNRKTAWNCWGYFRNGFR